MYSIRAYACLFCGAEDWSKLTPEGWTVIRYDPGEADEEHWWDYVCVCSECHVRDDDAVEKAKRLCGEKEQRSLFAV